MTFKHVYAIFILAVAVVSCKAPKKVPYLVEAENIPTEVLTQAAQVSDPLIAPGDLLNISVYASNPIAVAQFNKGQYLNENGIITQVSSASSGTSSDSENNTEYYLVNSQGDIEFPTLGTIHVAGLTKQQVCETIKASIYPKYIKIAPSVDLRLMNFKVTILGQVRNPGVYTSSNERLNILEALAKAGDLDIKGNRENIMLIRTNIDGVREIHRLNLQDRNLLLSPYFNLQQNDLIYVEPNKSARQNAWQMPTAWTTTLSVVGGLSSLAGLVIGIINLTDK